MTGQDFRIVVHPGGQGRFHIEAPGDEKFDQRNGIFFADGDALMVKIDEAGRVWVQGASNYDSPENRQKMAHALRLLAEHVEQGGALGTAADHG